MNSCWRLEDVVLFGLRSLLNKPEKYGLKIMMICDSESSYM